MALLPPPALNSVVAIGNMADDASDAKIRWTGTGFIYGVAVGESGDNFCPFLVTNRHVLEGTDSVIVKMNRADDLSAAEYTLDLEKDGHLITMGPGGLDVAVTPVRPEVWNVDRAATDVVPEGQSLSVEKAVEIGVSEGDGVFAVGFPMGLVGYDDHIVPIVRQGCLARVQDWLSKRARRILIDANIFPGNSGGPVFLRPSSIAIEGTKSIAESYLIGMVSAYIPYREMAYSLQTDRARMVFEENSGIAEIVPSDVIMETVGIAMRNVLESDA